MTAEIKQAEVKHGTALVAGGAAGALAVIAAVDQLLVQHGELAATTMAKLGPLLGPIWGNWSLLLLIGWLGWRAAVRWRESQVARAAEAATANEAALALAAGLTGLRGELHNLRSDLRTHADATETRLRDHEAGIRALQAEVSTVAGRVAIIEGRPVAKRRSASKPRVRA